MIIFDTETTGFITSTEAPLTTQPKIIELFAMAVDDFTLEEEGFISILIDPREPINKEISAINGITDDMVLGRGDFSSHLKTISDFWIGHKIACGHNVTFDCDMLEIELRRIGKVNKFPWPPQRWCTVELSEHYFGRRLKLIDLHIHLTGSGFSDAHRAEADVRATHTCLMYMKERGDLPSF